MIYLLCRNRVADYSRWKAVFDSHAEAGRRAGLQLVHMWRGVAEPSDVFFMFEVASVEMARAFMRNPEAARAAQTSGVIEGEYHFIRDAGED